MYRLAKQPFARNKMLSMTCAHCSLFVYQRQSKLCRAICQKMKLHTCWFLGQIYKNAISFLKILVNLQMPAVKIVYGYQVSLKLVGDYQCETRTMRT